MNSAQQDGNPNVGLQSPEVWLKTELVDQRKDIHDDKYETELPTAAHWWRDTSSPTIDTQPSAQEQSPTNFSLSDYRLLGYQTSDISQVDYDATEKEIKSKASRKRKITKDEEKKETVRRTRKPDMWKVNIVKNARLKGEEYVGLGGKIVPAKVMGPPCNCRLKCHEKIDEKDRQDLHDDFWRTCSTWEQRKQQIAFSVTESPKRRERCRSEVKAKRREVTFTYALLVNGQFVPVCKPMFLSTFAVSEKFVRHIMEKKRISQEIIGTDLRGKQSPKTKKSEAVKDVIREHIRSFPAERLSSSEDDGDKRYLDANLNIAAMHKLYVKECKEKGLPESDIVKQSYYRKIFHLEFNLGFKCPVDGKKESLDQIEHSSNSICESSQ